MTIVVTFFGQHYFHNVDLRFASVNIMKIMLTKKSDTIVQNVGADVDQQNFWKNYGKTMYNSVTFFGQHYENNVDQKKWPLLS